MMPCIPWWGYIESKGYGRLNRGHRGKVLAHRMVWEECFGPIPVGLVIDHLCRNRVCVNPEHMELVTPGENTIRGEGPAASNARKAHCPRCRRPFEQVGRQRGCRPGYRAQSLAGYYRRKAQAA